MSVSGRVSVIIPARGERFLQPTINDLLKKAAGDIEIIPVLDGWWPDPPLTSHERVHCIHWGTSKGMRPSINAAVALSRGEFILKLDAHCMVSEGFDEKLKADCDKDWVVVPRRYSLEPHGWKILENGKPPVDAHFLSYPFEDKPGAGLHGQVWTERAKAQKDVLLDEEMSSQGSSYFMRRSYWDKMIGPLDHARFTNFIQEFQEVGLKSWLTGGKVMCNKNVWYAHLHKGKEFGRGYFISKSEMSRGAQFTLDWFLNNRWPSPPRVHDLRWLIEHFWPVPTWPKTASGYLDWDAVERATATFNERYGKGRAVA